MTLSGDIVNCVAPNARYRLCYDIHFEKDCSDVHFHTLIKTVTGLELGGGTLPAAGTAGFEPRAGSVMSAEFDFRCNLNHGTYFLNCGVTGNGDRQLHRIVDALALRVLPGSEPSAFGHVNFAFSPSAVEEA